MELTKSPESVTGAYMREEIGKGESRKRRKGNGDFLTIRDAYDRNLKHVTVSFPLGCLISVTGVSGSGKSTLLFDLLAAGGTDNQKRNGCESITGFGSIGGMITVDQSPLGRMSRSNVATYTDVFTQMRNLFAGLPEAKLGKLTSKHFSFNSPGGEMRDLPRFGRQVHEHAFSPGSGGTVPGLPRQTDVSRTKSCRLRTKGIRFPISSI